MNDKLTAKHEPVLLKEVLEVLQVKDNAHLNKPKFIDATLGLGGHSEAIVKFGGEVLGIDADFSYLEIAKVRLIKACSTPHGNGGQFKLVQGNFRNIKSIAEAEGYKQVDGILFDLGVSSPQITSNIRGFSFQFGGAPLDMRLNPGTQAVTAADLINALDKKQLIGVFLQTLDYKTAEKISSAIIRKRSDKQIKIVSDLNEIIARTVVPKKGIHPSTLPYMALRMAVNTELITIGEALPDAFGLLKKSGRMVVISFHSGEDKIVKGFFRDLVSNNEAKLVIKGIVKPGEEEIKDNPRARSAKLRAIEKI